MVAAMLGPSRVIYNEGQRVPVKVWAAEVEDGAIEQAVNLSKLPFASKHIALMPDAHQGYGMPIGGVLFADRAVVPYAVGVDIGCGVTLIETDLRVENFTTLDAVLAQILRDVPVGNGPAGGHRLAEGEPFAFEGGEPLTKIIGEAETQLGSLGGGNHFIEIQAGADGRVYAMLHSGSRSVGKKVCDHHYRIAKRLCELWHVDLPDVELAFLPISTEEGQAYLRDMKVAMAWAEENRRRMAGKVISALGRHAGAQAWQVLDIHHNYAAFETHFGKNGIIHRKGAVRARAGETVLIPGSMGTASYIAKGLGAADSFETCQHGAGRAMSRGAARKANTAESLRAELDAAGVTLLTRDRGGAIDEAPRAYKDIEAVMAASADLVEPTLRLTPLGVVKG